MLWVLNKRTHRGACEGKQVWHVLLLRKQCIFDSPQSQAAEFELGIKPPQTTVGEGEVKVCLREKFVMI